VISARSAKTSGWAAKLKGGGIACVAIGATRLHSVAASTPLSTSHRRGKRQRSSAPAARGDPTAACGLAQRVARRHKKQRVRAFALRVAQRNSAKSAAASHAAAARSSRKNAPVISMLS